MKYVALGLRDSTIESHWEVVDLDEIAGWESHFSGTEYKSCNAAEKALVLHCKRFKLDLSNWRIRKVETINTDYAVVM